MIAYVDSSGLARAYLHDEDGHAEANRLLADSDTALVTGAWTRLQVASILARAAVVGQVEESALLALLDADLAASGPVAVVSAPEATAVEQALRLTRRHGLRVLDSYHLATAVISLPPLAERNESMAFASHDQRLLQIAAGFGLKSIAIRSGRAAASADNTRQIRRTAHPAT